MKDEYWLIEKRMDYIIALKEAERIGAKYEAVILRDFVNLLTEILDEGTAAGGSNAASKPEVPQPTKLCKGVGRPQTSNRRRLKFGRRKRGGR